MRKYLHNGLVVRSFLKFFTFFLNATMIYYFKAKGPFMYHALIKPVSYIKSFKYNVRVGIVGSRKYGSKWLVELLVKELPGYVTVVSGYGGVIDKTAVDTAKRLRMKFKEHRPDRLFLKRGGGAVRNKLIAQDNLRCLIAFMDTSRSSGTVTTIEYALKEKVKVFVIKSDPLDSRPMGRRPRCIILKKSKGRKNKRSKCIKTVPVVYHRDDSYYLPALY